MQGDKAFSTIVRTPFALACAPLTVGMQTIILATLFVYLGTISAKADSCPSIEDEIVTDRPDITNSSIVIPSGSLQIESGGNLSGETAIGLLTARIRACAGFSDVAPALEWRVSPVPGKGRRVGCA